VEDGFQGQGIGMTLLRRLAARANAAGIQTFTGEVAPDNQRVLKILRGSGPLIQLQPGYGSLRFGLRLTVAQLQVA
jgi:ribosomal protein S18 acetylase RimI-like enzyme